MLLFEAGADVKTRGWVAHSDALVNISPLELVLSWISKFGAKPDLVILQSILHHKVYAKLSIEGISPRCI